VIKQVNKGERLWRLDKVCRDNWCRISLGGGKYTGYIHKDYIKEIGRPGGKGYTSSEGSRGDIERSGRTPIVKKKADGQPSRKSYARDKGSGRVTGYIGRPRTTAKPTTKKEHPFWAIFHFFTKYFYLFIPGLIWVTVKLTPETEAADGDYSATAFVVFIIIGIVQCVNYNKSQGGLIENGWYIFYKVLNIVYFPMYIAVIITVVVGLLWDELFMAIGAKSYRNQVGHSVRFSPSALLTSRTSEGEESMEEYLEPKSSISYDPQLERIAQDLLKLREHRGTVKGVFGNYYANVLDKSESKRLEGIRERVKTERELMSEVIDLVRTKIEASKLEREQAIAELDQKIKIADKLARLEEAQGRLERAKGERKALKKGPKDIKKNLQELEIDDEQ
jgi:hypothetical protein